MTALSAVLGVVIVLSLGHLGHDLQVVLSPIAMGMFIYIAGSDLIPEMHKHDHRFIPALMQIACFLLGVGVMFALGMMGGHHH